MTRVVGSSIVSKCAHIVDVLVEARRPMAFSDIVAATGYVKSSTHRLLAVLLSEELAHYDTVLKTYSVGPRVKGWARASWQRSDLQKAATDEMEKLCDFTKLNVALSTLDNDSVLYLRTVDGFYARFAARPGDRGPLHSTASGKVLLAYMPENRRNEYLASAPFERFTDNTIIDPVEMQKNLELVRQRGYSFSEKEEFSQIIGMAAPLWQEEDKVVACVSIWSVTERTSIQELHDLAPTLIKAAKNISRQLF